MRQTAIWLVTFLFLVVVQAAFIASLPPPFSVIPLLFAVSIWIIQQEESLVGAAWLVGFGVWLDAWGIGGIPAATLFYLAAGGAAVLSARRLFTHRSLYGVLSCACVALLAKALVEAGIQFVVLLREPDALIWSDWSSARLWEACFCLLLISGMYQVSKPLRKAFGI